MITQTNPIASSKNATETKWVVLNLTPSSISSWFIEFFYFKWTS